MDFSLSRLIFSGAMLLLTAVFLALGIWQVQRLFWKLDLIERVEARVHAEPVAIPAPADWTAVNREADEYRRVTAAGVYNYEKEVLVQAVTERGAGFWVITPLMIENGSALLVNRGFVPSDRREKQFREAGNISGVTHVTGLLRMTEPGGGFLRQNDPQGGRWYSRDVAAMAAALNLPPVAPFFIDADATANEGGLPVGGLTVIRFSNSHLVYAITWFALAAMSIAASWAIYRRRFD